MDNWKFVELAEKAVADYFNNHKEITDEGWLTPEGSSTGRSSGNVPSTLRRQSVSGMIGLLKLRTAALCAASSVRCAA